MRYKIRQYHNKFKMRFSENYYVLKKRYTKWWENFREKGHERVTVMFIPHNEKRIFNFQISKFTISFLVMLFIVVIITSSYAIIKNAASIREEQRLMMNYKDIRAQLLRFEKLTGSISDLIDDIKPDIEELYALAAGNSDNVDAIWKINRLDEAPKSREEKNMENLLPEEINKLRNLQYAVLASTSTVKTVKNFIDVRSKVIIDTPSIVPTFGNITSLFGWRRSPFGFGRDFHSGIDIAAPSGTEIRATAPGSVSLSEWCGGYGYTIKLKHKYGFETIYGHCSELMVKSGDSVRKGQVIAKVGQTGWASGNHCHYEIKLGNVSINPYPYMSGIW